MMRAGNFPGGVAAAALAAWLLPMAACTSTDAQTAAAEVDARIRTLIHADNAGDLDAIAACYAPDAVLMPPSGPIVRGRAEIRRRYAAGFERFSLEVATHVEDSHVEQAWAYCRGTTSGRYVWRDGADPTPFQDKYLMILSRTDDGRWLVSTLMWNPLGTRASDH